VLNFYYRIFEYFEVGPGQLLLRDLENMLTLAVCMYCTDTVYGPVSETVKIFLGKVLKKSLFLS